MGRPAEKWPTYALENLEDSLHKLKQADAALVKAQDALLAGDDLAVLRALSDARVLGLETVDNLVRSRIGKYKQQERPAQWKRPAEEETAKATRRP
jgi:predicted RNase H-like nuclease